MSAKIDYPIDWIHEDYGWGRLHQGHGLDHDQLLNDLLANGGEGHGLREGWRLSITERHLHLMARVKWCGNHDSWPCDEEGWWHSHWCDLAASADPSTHFTEVFWEPDPDPTPVEAAPAAAIA